MYCTLTLIACLILDRSTSLEAFLLRSLQDVGRENNAATCWAKSEKGVFGSRKSSGGGGFGAPNMKTKPKKMSKKAVARKIQKAYGGTSPKEIAQATQKRVEAAMKSLPPHLQMATQLYQQLQKWDAHVSRLSVLQQANIPQQEVEGAERARNELERLYKEHEFTEKNLHNIFQKITWDASADAKAARAITGDMPRDIAARVDRACAIVAEAVEAAGDSGRCLDVGCGFGAIVPSLAKAGIAHKQIYGVDLSEEMIRNAQEQHPGVHFEAADFLEEYQDSSGFDAVIFCAALHDLPDTALALEKAASLLRPKGQLVICHPQGASHVLKQVSSNPVLVKRGLPNAEELRELDLGLKLDVEPSPAGSSQEAEDGYLAVLRKEQ